MIRLNDLVVWEPLNLSSSTSGTSATVQGIFTVPSNQIWRVDTFAMRLSSKTTSIARMGLFIQSNGNIIAHISGDSPVNTILNSDGTIWISAGTNFGGFTTSSTASNRTQVMTISGRRYYL